MSEDFQEELRRGWRQVSDELIEGDYVGSFKGELGVCLNVIHAYKSIIELVKKDLSVEEWNLLHRQAMQLRKEKYGVF